MIRRALCLVVVVTLSAWTCRADLSSDVSAVLGEKLLAKVKTGIEIVKLGDNAETSVVLYTHNAADQYVPASNLKVVTTSAALDALGADFKFRTLLVQHGEDLVLIGDGDPTLGDAEFLRKVGWDATTVFRNWAEAMAKRGLKGVRNVIVPQDGATA